MVAKYKRVAQARQHNDTKVISLDARLDESRTSEQDHASPLVGATPLAYTNGDALDKVCAHVGEVRPGHAEQFAQADHV